MANRKVWLQSADVMIDEESGALLVKIGDVEVKIDIGEADLIGLAEKITGAAPANKTLADLFAKLPSDPPTQATLAAVLAKLSSDPSTATHQATGNGYLANIQKDFIADGRAATVTSRANASALQAGVASHGTGLAATSTPYVRAYVLALKPNAADHQPPVLNAGTIYIATTDNVKASVPLAPGAMMELPPSGDLIDFKLIVATAADGCIVIYTT